MGYLFEHAEKMDIQAERQNTKEAREAARAAEERAKAAEERLRAAKERLQYLKSVLNLTVKDFILLQKASGCTKEKIQRELQTICGLKESDAEETIKQYWK